MRRLYITVAVGAFMSWRQGSLMRPPQAVHLVISLACTSAADVLLGVRALRRGVGRGFNGPPRKPGAQVAGAV